MAEKIKSTITLHSLEELSAILGTYDENLTYIARELNLLAYVDGMKIRLEGDAEDVTCGENVLSALAQTAQKGERIDGSKLAYCIELAKEGRSEEILNIESGAVAITARGKQIKCKTVGQKTYVDAIRKNTVVFGVGPAGTGKTYLAVCMAVSAFKSKQVEKIILTRPAVEAGEKLGFLPGDLHEKVDPYLRPLYDALYEMLGPENCARLIEKMTIEIAPLAYMRGRTLDDAFIILDEAQNTTPEQMKMFLTRLGNGSHIVVTGDLTQTDLPFGQKSGLAAAVHILEGIEDIAVHQFTERDVVRHRLVQKIILAYDKYERERSVKAAERKERERKQFRPAGRTEKK